MSTKKALQQESENNEIVFEYDGEKYTIPPARQWPLAVLRAQEESKLLGCVEALLGKEQMAKFESKPRTMGDLENLLNVAFESVEVDPKG